ncbi:MAG: lolA [Nevskia sp.]|nr:lolA [Nevskia sp.]
MNKVTVTFFASTLLAISTAHADSAQDALKRFVDGVQTLDTHFEQVQTDEAGKVTNRSSGHFLLSRPTATSKGEAGKFRWTYEKPYQQVSVCDGSKLWSYDPDLNQVTVREAKQALVGTPAALLSQRGGLSDAFTVQDAGVDGEAHLVKLVPKSKDSDFKSIELAIDKNGAPQRMRFADQIGSTSEITFSEIKTNSKIDPAQFQFTPPKKAEIVHGDGPVTTVD